MFENIIQTIAEHPYIGVGLLFVLCGVGLPLPEELVLIAGGYICAKFPERAELPWMMTWCAAGILAGDLLPYVLGRVFGAKLLRLRWMRMMVTRKRLAVFDRWFRKRGDLVIFIARFVAGIRSIAFFTAGMMKMRWSRFLLLDGLGIALIVPLMTYLGYRGAGVIDDIILRVQAVERGILILAAVGLSLTGIWYWLHKRRKRLAADRGPSESFVEPQLPVQVSEPEGDAPEGETADEDTAEPDAAGDSPTVAESDADASAPEAAGPATGPEDPHPKPPDSNLPDAPNSAITGQNGTMKPDGPSRLEPQPNPSADAERNDSRKTD